jgi:4-amino-4-deoxy-L-arabinose transferase
MIRVRKRGSGLDARLRWIYRGIVAAAAVVFLFRLGDSALLDPDEARFARTSLEMMRGTDFVVPTFEGEARLVKPPLLHWIQAAAFRVLGPAEGSARLPAALATLGTLVLLGWVARTRFGAEGALWAVAVYATMPLVVALGRIGTLDALLGVHVFAVVALDVAAPRGRRRQRGVAMGALLGLAFLIKGPVGVGTALLAMLAGRTAAGRNVVPDLGPALAALGAWAVVVLPWGLAFVERIGAYGVARLLHDEVVDRAVTGTSHVHPPWFYAPVLAIAVLPWTGILLAGLVRALARRRDPEAQTGLYAAAALLAGLAMFTLAKGKNANYILPLMPIVALLVTWEIGQELSHPTRRRSGANLTVATCIALAIGLGGAAALKLEVAARGAAVAGAAAFAIAALVGFVGLLRARPRIVFGSAAAAGGVFMLAALVAVSPALSENRSARPLVETVLELSSPRPIVLVGVRVPSLTWYLDRVPEKLASPGELGGRLGLGDGALYVIAEDDLDSIPSEARVRVREIGRAGKYRVFEERAEPGPPPSRKSDE